MEIFQFAFMQRAFAAFLISLISPLLGLFLILLSITSRRYPFPYFLGRGSGWLYLRVNPTWSTIIVVALMSLVLEYLRQVYRNYSWGGPGFPHGRRDGHCLSLNEFESGQCWRYRAVLIRVYCDHYQWAGTLINCFKCHYFSAIFFLQTAHVCLNLWWRNRLCIRLPVRLISTLFTVLTGVVIAIIMPIVGSLLVSAILIFPAAIAMRLTKYFDRVILIGIIIRLNWDVFRFICLLWIWNPAWCDYCSYLYFDFYFELPSPSLQKD